MTALIETPSADLLLVRCGIRKATDIAAQFRCRIQFVTAGIWLLIFPK